jgi:UDPglucose 6-dehydrogenase
VTAYSVVGLGKLGASMAAAMAHRGHRVVGVDVDPGVVSALAEGRAPVHETGLQELVTANRARLSATSSHEEAIDATDVTFVVVPTPSEPDGTFSIRSAASAFEEIGRALERKDGYHLVVLTSTVLPGATRYGLLPVLEQASGKRCGEDFGLCYSPEFIALGRVIRDVLNPDFLLFGESVERAGARLERSYAEIVENAAPCRRMSFENAELAKIALNAYVTTKITFANMLADICERIPGGDVDVVSDALGLDRRVGRAYLTGGLGFGGPCFPRDNLALASFADLVGSEAPLPVTTNAVNERVADEVLERVGVLTAGGAVGVLGLAYKPLSNVVEESQGIAIARRLAERGARVVGFDPLAASEARAELDGLIRVTDSLDACLAEADVLVLATPDPAFLALTADRLAASGVRLVVDCWRILADDLADSPIDYAAVGRSRTDTANAERLAALWRSVAVR